MTEVNTCDFLTDFVIQKIVPHCCNIPPYKHAHTLILSTPGPVLTLQLPSQTLTPPFRWQTIFSPRSRNPINGKSSWRKKWGLSLQNLHWLFGWLGSVKWNSCGDYINNFATVPALTQYCGITKDINIFWEFTHRTKPNNSLNNMYKTK